MLCLKSIASITKPGPYPKDKMYWKVLFKVPDLSHVEHLYQMSQILILSYQLTKLTNVTIILMKSLTITRRALNDLSVHSYSSSQKSGLVSLIKLTLNSQCLSLFVL